MKWLFLAFALVTAPEPQVTLHELISLSGVVPLWVSPACVDTQGLVSMANAPGTFTCAMFGLDSTGYDTVHLALGKKGGNLHVPVLALFSCQRVPETEREVDCETVDPDVFHAHHTRSI